MTDMNLVEKVEFDACMGDDGNYLVKRTSYKIDKDCWYTNNRKDVVETVLFTELNEDSANYLKKVLSWHYRNYNRELTSQMLVDMRIDLPTLAFRYASDTLGNGWAMHNAMKLLSNDTIDLWLDGAGMRFGILDHRTFNLDKTREALREAISKCMDAYCH